MDAALNAFHPDFSRRGLRTRFRASSLAIHAISKAAEVSADSHHSRLRLRNQEHAKKISRKKRRPYNQAKVANQKPVPCAAGVAGGGAEKALEPTACRR